jgi:CheY-like chemotaxis protein
VRNVKGQVVGISKVERDITDRRRIEEALALAKDAAEAASRELEAFSYSVAHDLRAPLRGMNGFAQALLDDYADKLDADGRDFLEEIRSNARKMGDLIDALLHLSRVTRSDWRPERLDLSALVRACAARLAAAEPRRNVTCVIQEHLVADADLLRARALFDNLIGNAWKFTAGVPAARVEFGAMDEDGTRLLFVRHNGAGFDMAHASRLFAPFSKASHGGRVPRYRHRARHGATDRPSPWGADPGRGKNWRGRGVLLFTLAEIGREDHMSKVLLLVEDNPSDEKLTLRAFKKSGVLNEIVVVRDGAEALDYLFAMGKYEGRDASVLPAVVMLDLKLPRIGGLEVLQRIRANDRTKTVPVVILTGSRENEDVARGYALGANAYVRKPVDFIAFAEVAKTLGLFWLLLNEPPPPPGRGSS